MAQKSVDLDHDTPLPITPGADTETLTNTVRIIFNDDLTAEDNKKDQIIMAIQRGKEAIIEYLSAIQNKS
jgi:hypothetical protein